MNTSKIIIYLVVLVAFTHPINAQDFTPNEGKFVTVNDANIYYEEYGEGKPLVLLHHFMSTGTAGWSTYIPSLAKSYKVIALDLRGHGKSTDPKSDNPWKLDQSASDLIAFLNSLNITKVSAIGGSAGASTLLNAATIKPERFEKIVIVGGSPFRSQEFRDWIRKNWSEEVPKGFIKLHGNKKASILNRQFREFANRYRDHELTPDRLNTITSETMIVHGDNDPIVPVKYAWGVYTSIPNSNLWIVPKGGHLPYLYPANRADFTTRILEFLSAQKKN